MLKVNLKLERLFILTYDYYNKHWDNKYIIFENSVFNKKQFKKMEWVI